MRAIWKSKGIINLKNSGIELPLGGREKAISADFHTENFNNTEHSRTGGDFVGIYVYILHYLNVSNI